MIVSFDCDPWLMELFLWLLWSFGLVLLLTLTWRRKPQSLPARKNRKVNQ